MENLFASVISQKVGSKIIICELPLGRRFGVLRRENEWNNCMRVEK